MNLKDIKYLKLGLTNYCNSACLTCWHSNSNKHTCTHLDEGIYSQIRKEVFPTIKILDLLSGGEVFLYKGIDRVLADIQDFKFKTIIESNFSVLTDRHRQILKNLDVEFVVSLDGSSREMQEFLRPQCHFDTVVGNIKYFTRQGKRVTIRMTVSNHNFYDMKNMLRLAETLGVEGVKFHGVQYLPCLEPPLKFSKPPEDMEFVKEIMGQKYKVLYDFFLDFYRRNFFTISPMRGTFCILDPITATGAGFWVKIENILAMCLRKECCPIAREFIRVDIDGNLYFCSVHGLKSIGNLNQHSLKDIIENKEYDATRKKCSCAISKRYTRGNKGNQNVASGSHKQM